jgi:hypothetical protein
VVMARTAGSAAEKQELKQRAQALFAQADAISALASDDRRERELASRL